MEDEPMITRHQLAQKLLELADQAAGGGDFESAVWATVEAGKALGHLAD